MSKLTESQLAEIAARLGTRSGPTPSTMHQEPTFSESEVRLLLDHIAAVEAERDEAQANIGEVNQLLADTLSRTKIAEQHVERLTAELAAAKARAADQIKSANLVEVVLEKTDPAKWAAMQIVKGGRPDMTAAEAVDMIESVVRSAIKSAHAIERGEHEQG